MTTTTGEITVTSPFDGRELGSVPSHDEAHVQRCIGVAEHARSSSVPQPHERAEVLERAVVLLGERADAFAESISAEAGKPITIAAGEVERAIDTLRYAAIEARTLAGDVVPMAGTSAGAGTVGITLRLPVGVVAAITPFNFPLNLVVHKLAPAIAAGCPIVHKPASATPLTSVLLHELLRDAGQDPDRLHLVTGSGRTVGDALVVDPRIRHISFTGSSEVGWALPRRAHRARVSLELGNSTPLLVFDDADLDAAVDAAARFGYAFAGQSCIAVQRLLVQRPVYDDVVERMTEAVSKIAFGDPSDPDVACGPVIDSDARDTVLARIRDAVDAGARLVTGGDHDGNVIEPALLVDVDPRLDVSCAELFGPAVVMTPFDDEPEAVALANGTPYGLQAGVFTSNVSRAIRVAEQLEFGGVTVNVPPTFRSDQMPYGGTKQSGNTKEGPRWAVRELTEERLVLLGRG
ncbi:MAG: aldehyde dehydrogenase family protein [Thermoleophilia bacterium]|nr:aldehyde dehydrogenase family protein [Thermoleophilia bacterium]